jgi:hypothetical protein
MRTDTLIEMLAREAGPAPRALAARRLATAAVLGLLASGGTAVAILGAIPGPMFATHVPWSKIVYAGALALAAGWLTARLSRPAAAADRPRRVTFAVVIVMAALGAVSLWAEPDGLRVAALLGRSWKTCPWSVLALSLPALAAALWAVRGLAPTRPHAAGSAAGLLAGAIGAIGYALHCPEASIAFVAVWYTAGIALAGVIGAALGPLVLRW